MRTPVAVTLAVLAVLSLAACGTSDDGGALPTPSTDKPAAQPLDRPCRLLGSLLAANALGRSVGPASEAPSTDGGVSCTYHAVDGPGSVTLTTYPTAEAAAAYGRAAASAEPITGLGDAAAADGGRVVVRKGGSTFVVVVDGGPAGDTARTLARQLLGRL